MKRPGASNCRELLGLVRRAANAFATLGGPPRRGLHAAQPDRDARHLVGRRNAGYAVPINFLLQVESIAGCCRRRAHASWWRSVRTRCWTSGRRPCSCATACPGWCWSGSRHPARRAEEGVVDFHAALMAQPDDHLVFGEPGRDDDVAAYFHTGGTTGTPGSSRTRIAVSWWPHSAARCWATCVRATRSPPRCRCFMSGARSSGPSAPSWAGPACW